MRISSLGSEEAKSVVFNALLGCFPVPDGSVWPELVRSCLWALSRAGEETPHTTRVLNVALDFSLTLDPSDEPEMRRQLLREALDELEATGCAVHLGDGRWQPGCAYLVSVPHTTGEHLLIGGLPTGMIPLALRKGIVPKGALRRVSLTAALQTWFLDDLQVPVMPWNTWLNHPAGSLENWGMTILREPLQDYQPEDGRGAFEIYFPLSDQAHQFFRWQPLQHPCSIPDGVYLARRSRVYGAKEYKLIQLTRGGITKVGQILLGDEHRRLMYFLDYLGKKQTVVRIAADPPHSFRVLVGSELPISEGRLLRALGRLEANPDGSRFPQRWIVPENNADLVRSALRALHITIKET